MKKQKTTIKRARRVKRSRFDTSLSNRAHSPSKVNVEEGALDRAKSMAAREYEKSQKRRSRRRTARQALAAGVDYLGTRLPVIKPLTNKISDKIMPHKWIKQKIENRFSLKLESTREAIALTVALVLGSVFGYNVSQEEVMGLVEAGSGAGAALIMLYYAIKRAFQNETEDDPGDKV